VVEAEPEYCSGIYLVRLRHATKISADVLTEIRTADLPNTSLELYRYTSPLGALVLLMEIIDGFI
jgi:hypothetical protein